MKKLLLIAISITICCVQMSVVAQSQRRAYKQDIHPDQAQAYTSVIPGQKIYDNSVIGTTWYDAQTYAGSVMPRVWAYDDGTVGATWMASGEDLTPERGAGYNYFNGTEFGTPDLHVGPEDRQGWPSYAPYGPTGEIIAAYRYIEGEGPIWFHHRPVKGEGDWEMFSVTGPEGLSLVWHSMMTSGENNEHIHLLAYTYGTEYQGQENALLYYRSSDGGESWDPEGLIIDGLGSDDLVTINSLAYTWANPVGNTIAFTYGFDQWGGWVFKSDDNGDSWDQIPVMESEFDPLDPPPDSTDYFGGSYYSTAIALDSDAKAHVVFPRMCWKYSGSDWYYYPLEYDGLIYWNEDMDPLDTTIISSTGLENLEDGDYLCGYAFGYDPIYTVDIPENQPDYAGGLCGFPVISIDAQDNIFISSCNPSPDYISAGGYLYRHIVANSSLDGGASWTGMIDLNDDLQFIFSECVYPMMAPVVDNTIWFLFQEDIYCGSVEWPEEQQAEPTENRMFMTSVPKSVFVGLDENVAKLNFEVSDIYPNPANTFIQFNVKLEEYAAVQVNIVNVVGQSVQTRDFGQLTSGNQNLRIEVSELPSGIYYCNVNVDGQSATRKIVIQ